ncbi:MAG: tetratricopeptide repeat protein [Bryobacteraceae bacterium]
MLRRLGFVFLPCLFLAGCATFLTAAAPPENVVVVPFSNLSPNRSLDWVGESLAVAVFETLYAELPFVVPSEERDAVLRQMNVRKYSPLTEATVLEIAVNLDAVLVVSGSYGPTPAKEGARAGLKIRARILNARKLRRVKDFEVSGAFDDLSLLQAQLAWRILLALNPGATTSEQDYLTSHPPVRLDALERYVRGLIATSYDQKHRFFSAAARLQPDYSGPCYQLGALYYARREYRSAAEWLAKVVPADAHFREALFRLGLARYHIGDYAHSVEAFRKLAEATPLSEVLNNLGAAQLRTGDAQAAVSFKQAIESDPADPDYYFNAGYELFRRNELEAAARQFEAALERKPDDETATGLLARCKRKEGGRPGDMQSEALERLKENYDESAWRQLKAMLDPETHK